MSRSSGRSCTISPSGVFTCQLPFSRYDIADGVIVTCFLLGEGVALHLEQTFGNQSLPTHILQGFAAGAIATCSWQTRKRLRRFLIDASADDDQAIDMDLMELGEAPGIHIDEPVPSPVAELEGIVHPDEPRMPSPDRVTDDLFDYVPPPAKPNTARPLSTPMAQPECQPPLIAL